MIVEIYKVHIKEIKIKNFICFDDLIKAKTLETKTILISEKNFKNLVICFIRYVDKKLIKILSLYYHELIGIIEEHER